MILLLDAQSDLGARVWKEIGNLISSRHIFTSGPVVNFCSTEHGGNLFWLTIWWKNPVVYEG